MPRTLVNPYVRAFLDAAGLAISSASIRDFSAGIIIEYILEKQNIHYESIAAVCGVSEEHIEQLITLVDEENDPSLAAARELGKLVHQTNVMADAQALLALRRDNRQEAQARAGVLLEGFLDRRHMLQKTLTGKIGLSQIAGRWIAGAYPIPEEKLGPIFQVLKPRPPEHKDVVELVYLCARADILTPERFAFLSNALKERKWDRISFPALDDAWLEDEPVTRQGGMLLRDLRNRACISQPEFAQRLKVSLPLVQKWEGGKVVIMEKHCGDICRILDLKRSEKIRFLEVTRRSRLAARKSTSLQRKATASGKEVEDIALPRPNALLWEYSIESELGHGELATRINTPEGTLKDWMRGASISPSRIGELIQHLKLKGERAIEFALAVRPALTAFTGHEWLATKIEAGEWRSISLPALDQVWLDAHRPVGEQAGLFLRDALERRNRVEKLAQTDLGQAAGIPQSRISRIAVGKERMLPQQVEQLSRRLNLTSEEEARLAQLAFRSNEDIKRAHEMRKTTMTALGSTAPASAHHELRTPGKVRGR